MPCFTLLVNLVKFLPTPPCPRQQRSSKARVPECASSPELHHSISPEIVPSNFSFPILPHTSPETPLERSRYPTTTPLHHIQD